MNKRHAAQNWGNLTFSPAITLHPTSQYIALRPSHEEVITYE